MKNEKFCFSKGTGLIALLGILLVGVVLFAQVTNQPTSTNSRAGISVQTLITTCTGVKGQVAKTFTNYGGQGKDAYLHFSGLYYSTTKVNPNVATTDTLTDYCATEAKPTYTQTAAQPVATVQELITFCEGVKGEVAKTFTGYGGQGKDAYLHFSGKYYSTTVKNPNVTVTNSSRDYCATEAKPTYTQTAAQPVATVQDLIAVCTAVKGYRAKEFANYSGAGVSGYTKFTGLYYSTTVKNPNVDFSDNHAYCATTKVYNNWCSGYNAATCTDDSDPTCALVNNKCVPKDVRT